MTVGLYIMLGIIIGILFSIYIKLAQIEEKLQ